MKSFHGNLTEKIIITIIITNKNLKIGYDSKKTYRRIKLLQP